MKARSGFFIGWAGTLPPAQRSFVRATVALALFLFLALGFALSAGIDDPGDGAADWGREAMLEGIVTTRPYPLLHLANGRTVMMAGFGKSGVDLDASFDGKAAKASGFMVKRGALDMLQSSPDAFQIIDGAIGAPHRSESLGRWRVSGEICDGKCYAGVMRPGAGVAHKACASFCVLGGVPPVLVTTAPLAGHSFLLIAGPGNEPLPTALLEAVGLRITVEGTVERVGDLLILHADPQSLTQP